MNDIDLDELERKARAANIGDWYTERCYPIHHCHDDKAALIAAASPPVMLALIARIRALEAERDAIAVARNMDRTEWMTTYETMLRERDAIRRQADAATINLGNARDAHQEELGNAAAIELRLTERVAELEVAADYAVTIADEAFGLGPVESLDATLSRIERGIFEQRKRLTVLEQLVEQLRCGDLDAFHDGELDPDRAAAFREHLGRCAKCQAGLDSLMQETVATSRTP